MRATLTRLAPLFLAPFALLACERSDDHAGPGSATGATLGRSQDEILLDDLRAYESERREATDFATLPASNRTLGADPYVIRSALHDRLVGLLRGGDAIVLLDEQLQELARAVAPPSPSGLAIDGEMAYVVGEYTPLIQPFHLSKGNIEARPSIPLPGVRALRDVAVGPGGVLYAIEEEHGRLFTLVPSASPPAASAPAPSKTSPSPKTTATPSPKTPATSAPDPSKSATLDVPGYEVTVTPTCAGAFRVARTKTAVIVDCLTDHTILVSRVDARGELIEGSRASIQNDGPLWSFAAFEDAHGLLIASGGVENKPLDRTHGSFENIDSFVYLDRVAWSPAPAVARVAELNVSEHGVVVPKALDIQEISTGLNITVTGYGGESFAEIMVQPPFDHPTLSVSTFALPPGTNAIARDSHDNLVIANPLLDEWIQFYSEHIAGLSEHVASPGDDKRTVASRLGEHLIFTTLIAPWNRSNGPLSRFTCETCHFEGYVDGRTHSTGRGDIHATTKPLLGLFNNRPHFSRALDPDLSSVAHNEFRVAGARSGHDPIFDFGVDDRRYFPDIGARADDLTAPRLRRAFMAFLMDFSHRTSPLLPDEGRFTDLTRRGAEAFRDRCERCHEARLASDKPSSRVPFQDWARYVFSAEGPLVWGQAKYEKTGVLPYVHDEGARVPSLRRLHKKHPYFTNGTAKTLADVLTRARFTKDAFFHDGAPAGPDVTALTDDERAAIEAFLRLL